MIESISISNVATYAATPERLDGLSQFNFLFGSNGTGKTTVSRVIADEGKFPTCSVKWKAGAKLQALVYSLGKGRFEKPIAPQSRPCFRVGEMSRQRAYCVCCAPLVQSTFNVR
jgi:hypothetical protein